jgi:peptidoglycan/LPS O-acetylase OafA/YrhL
MPIPKKNILYFVMFFISLPFIFKFTKDSRVDRYIGELSYPIYISHIFVNYCMNILKMPREGGDGINLTILTVSFAIILNEFVAKKIEKFRNTNLYRTYYM